MCTEHITKHRLFSKEKTEFYKVLLKTEDGKYFSPWYCTEYIVGERVEAFLNFPGLPVTDNHRLSPDADGCEIAIHLFENIEDTKFYLETIKIPLNGQIVIGVLHCNPEDFYCCGLTEIYYDGSVLSSRRTWLPTACYNAATLVRVEEI